MRLAFIASIVVVGAALGACVGSAPGEDVGGSEQHVEVLDASAADASDGGVTASFAEIGPIVAHACGGCHSGWFDTLEKIKASREDMIDEIGSGAMPFDQVDWYQTADGAAVLDYLQNSPELR